MTAAELSLIDIVACVDERRSTQRWNSCSKEKHLADWRETQNLLAAATSPAVMSTSLDCFALSHFLDTFGRTLYVSLTLLLSLSSLQYSFLHLSYICAALSSRLLFLFVSQVWPTRMQKLLPQGKK